MRVSDADIISNIEAILHSFVSELADEATRQKIYGDVSQYLFILYKAESIHDYDVEVMYVVNNGVQGVKCQADVQHDPEGPFIGYSVDSTYAQVEDTDPVSAYDRAMKIL